MKHQVEEIRLKNGARGLLIDVPEATTMSLLFQFRAGSRYAKSKDIEQVAHIMEHMAFGANSKFNAEQFEFEFKKNGAYRNAYTSDIAMIYESDCADFEWDRILDLQQLAICHPKFNSEDLNSEKSNVHSELTNYLNDYQRVLWPKVYQSMGEDTLTIRQALATISNVSLSDVREHYKRTHTSDNMRFVIAGKLAGRKSEIKRKIESFELPRGERFEIPRDTMSKANPVIVRRKDAANLTFGLSMVIDRQLSDEELDALSYINHILVGTFYSRIFGKVRKLGLAYDITAYATSSVDMSDWEIAGEVNHESAPKLFDIITSELKNVLNGNITEDEIEASKSFALGRYQMGAQTVSQIGNFYTGRYFSDGFIKNYEKVPEMIKKVNSEIMVKVARSFIEKNTWVLAAVSSGERQEIVELSEKVAPLFETS